jgi:hypothetical protein
MSAMDLPKYSTPPMHRFESRQQMRRNDENESVLAYVLIPKTDEQGETVFEDFPTAQGIIKRPVLVEDLEQPISEDFIIIRPHGSKDEYEMIAEQWIRQSERQARSGDPNFISMEWVMTIRNNYENWKSGKAPVLEGMDIRLWTALPKPQREMLLAAGFPTVEQVAAANEQALQQIGVGARQVKNRAVEFLAKSKTADTVALKNTVAEQTKQIEQLLAAVAKLTAVATPEHAEEVIEAAPEIKEAEADPVGDFVREKMAKKSNTLSLKK